MLVNIIGTAVILVAAAGAVLYLLKKHRMAKKSGSPACVGCSCGCGSNSCSENKS